MRTYPYGVFYDDEVAALEKIKKIFDAMPDELDLGIDENNQKIKPSCHLLADAFSCIIGMDVERGYFIKNEKHSWLMTKHNNAIEIYPWGVSSQPFLLSRAFLSNSHNLYKVQRDILDDLTSSPIYKAALEKLVEYMHAAEDRLNFSK